MSLFSRPLSKSASWVLISMFVAGALACAIWHFRAGDSGVASLMVDGAGAAPKIDVSIMLISQQGIVKPSFEPASLSLLDDAAEVIGIQVGDECRAYSLAALSQGPSSHIVNDLFGNVPVTITYCDMGDRARVFTGPRHGSPLDINQGGLDHARRMLLRVGASDDRYFQDTGTPYQKTCRYESFPFPSYPFVRSTWKEWKSAHPTTKVYSGRTSSRDSRTRSSTPK
jgi:hypothetical protein